MHTYIFVSFVLCLIGLVVNMVSLVIVEYPTTQVNTVGKTVFNILIGAGFAAWSGYILFN